MKLTGSYKPPQIRYQAQTGITGGSAPIRRVISSASIIRNTVEGERECRRIMDELRIGRPGLAGKVPFLNAMMENVFRSGTCEIVPNGEYGETGPVDYSIFSTFGGDTLGKFFMDWRELGLSREPSVQEKEQAYAAYTKWTEMNPGFPDGDISEAAEAFNRKYTTPYGIELKKTSSLSPEQIYFTMALMRSVPEWCLKSDAFREIDLYASRGSGARFGEYVPETGLVKIMGHVSRDRHLLTGFLLHELGHALCARLSYDSFSVLSSLYSRFIDRKAIFGTDFMGMSPSARRSRQESPEEFMAENFMHYNVMGEEGMKAACPGNETLAGELAGFYSSLQSAPELAVKQLDGTRYYSVGPKGLMLRKGDVMLMGKRRFRLADNDRGKIAYDLIELGADGKDRHVTTLEWDRGKDRQYIIGRRPAGSNGISMGKEDPTLSGNHAAFMIDRFGHAGIVDLGSTNGTFIKSSKQ